MSLTPRNDSAHTLVAFIIPTIGLLPPSPIRAALARTFRAKCGALATIERCFRTLTRQHRSQRERTAFLANWHITSNSERCISGLSNRLSLRFFRQEPGLDERALMRAIACLDRITDADLGVGGRVPHRELFARMARYVCGSEKWLLSEYVTESASRYKAQQEQMSLRERDLLFGLLTTLVHAVYTRGEFEFIHPLFYRWMNGMRGDSAARIARQLAWISVHCGAVGRAHCTHAFNAVEEYCDATDATLQGYDLDAIFGAYLSAKAAVMESLLTALQGTPLRVPAAAVDAA